MYLNFNIKLISEIDTNKLKNFYSFFLNQTNLIFNINIIFFQLYYELLSLLFYYILTQYFRRVILLYIIYYYFVYYEQFKYYFTIF